MPTLSPPEIDALLEALDDEYRAWATYDRIVADFGEVRPFVAIRDSEARHIAALGAVMRRHGVPVPENPWPGRVPSYASLRDACAAAVEGEVDNERMYARLLGSTARADILAVFRHLSEASRQRHLPAFRRCLAREGRVGGRRRCG